MRLEPYVRTVYDRGESDARSKLKPCSARTTRRRDSFRRLTTHRSLRLVGSQHHIPLAQPSAQRQSPHESIPIWAPDQQVSSASAGRTEAKQTHLPYPLTSATPRSHSARPPLPPPTPCTSGTKPAPTPLICEATATCSVQIISSLLLRCIHARTHLQETCKLPTQMLLVPRHSGHVNLARTRSGVASRRAPFPSSQSSSSHV